MSKVDDLVAWATAELGKPYVYGDAGPGAFDCSGLIQYVFAKVGISLPHNAAAQQKTTARVASPLPGDLVFFGDPAYHVGLYVGAGKMITAPHAGASVHLTDVGTPTNYGRVTGLGTALAPVTGVLTAAATGTVSLGSDLLGGVRGVVLEGVFVVLGLGLVGYGLYRMAAPGLRTKESTVEGLLS